MRYFLTTDNTKAARSCLWWGEGEPYLLPQGKWHAGADLHFVAQTQEALTLGCPPRGEMIELTTKEATHV